MRSARLSWIIETAGQSTASAERMISTILKLAWPSYVLIFLLQSKVIWRIWELRDLTSGDTAQYFHRTLARQQGFHLDTLWSPLYTAFYGSLLFATSDPYAATILHRVIIVLAAA